MNKKKGLPFLKKYLVTKVSTAPAAVQLQVKQMLGINSITLQSLKELRNDALTRETCEWFKEILKVLTECEAWWDNHLGLVRTKTPQDAWEYVFEATRVKKLPIEESERETLGWDIYKILSEDGAWQPQLGLLCNIKHQYFVNQRQMAMFGANCLEELPVKRWRYLTKEVIPGLPEGERALAASIAYSLINPPENGVWLAYYAKREHQIAQRIARKLNNAIGVEIWA